MEYKKVKYNTPIEVTKDQYYQIMREFSGIVAGRISEGKYYIKVWGMKYAPDIAKVLNMFV